MCFGTRRRETGQGNSRGNNARCEKDKDRGRGTTSGATGEKRCEEAVVAMRTAVVEKESGAAAVGPKRKIKQ